MTACYREIPDKKRVNPKEYAYTEDASTHHGHHY